MSHEPVAEGDQLALPSRRSVIRAGAWTAPVVMVVASAPYAAASPGCTPVTGHYVVTWGTTAYSRSADKTSGTAVITSTTSGAKSVTMTLSSVVSGGMVRGNGTENLNLLVSSGNVSGTGQKGLTFEQYIPGRDTSGRANRQSVTLSFSTPVKNLSFLLTDIDSLNGDFYDQVEVSGATFTSSTPTGSEVIGSGTQASPFHIQGTGANHKGENPQNNSTGKGGNVRVTVAGPVSSLVLTYWNSETHFDNNVNNDQIVYLTDLSFDATPPC